MKIDPKSVRSPLALLPLALVLLLSACGTPAMGPDESAARSAVLAAVDEAFAADAERDGDDLASQSALASQAVEPTIVIRRHDMDRERRLLTLTVDMTAEPPTATAEIGITVSGVASLWQVYPDPSLGREHLGDKAIDLTGEAVVTAQRVGGQWHVVAVDHGGLSQGDRAAAVTDWWVSPDPLVAGSSDNAAFAALDVPTASDELLVAARGRHLRPRGILVDDGSAPDEVAADGTYSGLVDVDADARVGRHLGFVTALNYTATTDLSTGEDGEFLVPYTDTILPVVVEVVGGE